MFVACNSLLARGSKYRPAIKFIIMAADHYFYTDELQGDKHKMATQVSRPHTSRSVFMAAISS